jgi:CspA family cold shock protein
LSKRTFGKDEQEMKGTVKLFTERGFGFITGEDGQEYFCHFSSVVMPGYKVLYAGQEVDFDPDEGNPKGPSAINILPGPIPEGIQSRSSFRDGIIQKDQEAEK